MVQKKRGCAVAILAAGQGKRMRSHKPKVLHELCGQPILFHILNRLNESLPENQSIALVVGKGREEVIDSVKKHPIFKRAKVEFVHQEEQNGTGHAVRCAMESPWGEEVLKSKLPVLVLPGDSPLIPADLITGMTEPLKKGTALRLLTCTVPDPTGYGRIIRRGRRGDVLRIVEEKDASTREKEVREVGASIYCFDPGFLSTGLRGLRTKNAQGEYYLTDLIALASRSKKKIEVLEWGHWEDLRGINNPWELAEAHAILNRRLLREHAMAGVRFVDPARVQIEPDVVIGEGAEIHPGVYLKGSTRIDPRAVIESNCQLENVKVGEGAHIKAGTVASESEIGADSKVGPNAHLRPGSVIGIQAKIGNFVEIKNSTIGEKTSIAHLSYVGDAKVGNRVNIGCGFVTCNFDGRVVEGKRKHETIIEDDVFLGSDCQSVAPVRIGRGAYVASGSTITEDVEAESLAIARSRQVNKPGYARKLRENGK